MSGTQNEDKSSYSPLLVIKIPSSYCIIRPHCSAMQPIVTDGILMRLFLSNYFEHLPLLTICVFVCRLLL